MFSTSSTPSLSNGPLSWNFSNYGVLVCGASQGIGAAIATFFLKSNAKVFLVARNEAKLREVAKRSGREENAVCIVLDLMQFEEMELKLKAIGKEEISILVNNAGGPKAGPLLSANPEQFLDGVKTHLLASQKLTQLFVPKMRERKYGRIINIISTSVKSPIPNLGVSNTIRAAMAAWSKSLSLELTRDGITINNILPGYTETERLHQLAAHSAKDQGREVSDILDQWKKAVPAGRFAKPEEIAEVVGFLASPSASYISGVSLPVDGGRTLAY